MKEEKKEIYATLREIQDKFKEAGFGTRITNLGEEGGRLIVSDKEELIFLDGTPPNDWGLLPFETHVLRDALRHTPESLQRALDVLYGEGVFTTTKDMELYLYGGRLNVYLGEDICIKVSYPLGEVWTVDGKDLPPKVEVTVVSKLCVCCEAPDEPAVRCNCGHNVCLTCQEHKHHDGFIGLKKPRLEPLHYDQEGSPITFCRWVQLTENPEAKRVAETTIGKRYWISTVWLGLDHSFGPLGTPPVIFETMVFPKGGWGELDINRYTTLDEAKEGHERMVKKWWRRRRGLKGRDEGLPKLPKAQ